MFEVFVENVGAIRNFTLNCESNTGGVLVVKGNNATGKSTFIAILRSMLVANGKFTPTDGEKRGRVEAFGRELSVTSQNRFKGDLEVPALEGKLDFSDFILPLFKTRATRDAARVKAMITLNNVQADARLFYDLCGGEAAFKEIASVDDIATDDLCQMAGNVRRAIHAKALDKEKRAEHSRAAAKACADLAQDVDITLKVDMPALHDASQAAAGKLAQLNEQFDAANRSQTTVKEQQKRLDALISGYSGPTVEEATTRAKALTMEYNNNNENIKALEERLTRARAAQAAVSKQIEAQDTVGEAAVSHFEAVEALQEAQKDADDLPCPTSEDLLAAREAKKAASEAIEKAAVIKTAQEKSRESAAHKEAARKLEREAEEFRTMAEGVDAVLTASLPAGPLKWKDGLVLDTDRGADISFDECSDGEKWRIALPYGIKAVGTGGVIPVVQSAWQDLGVEMRIEVATMCRDAKVWIVTAELTPGQLRVEEFKPSTLAESNAELSA